MKNLVTLLDLTVDDARAIMDLSAKLKSGLVHGDRPRLLAECVLTQVFEKPSLRTRLSFDAAMAQLGGTGIFLLAEEAGLGGRESAEDVARVIGGYSDIIVLRTFSQKLIEIFAKHSGAVVINGLSDESHPCQALTDLFTMREMLGQLTGRTVVYVGDGNNVAASLAAGCAMFGMNFIVAAPKGYELSDAVVKEVKGKYPKALIEQTNDPYRAVVDADVIYTDVWASMGQEAEKDERNRIFVEFQVNQDLLDGAPKEVSFMHCLPARRGIEVTDEVIDGPASVAFIQAENRMHIAKGIMAYLLERGGDLA